MIRAFTGTWLATRVEETTPLCSPKYVGEWRALMVWMRVSNFWPSRLEWRASPRSYCRKMGSAAIALLPRSLASPSVSRRRKRSDIGDQRLVADIGEVAHLAQPYIRPPGNQTGGDGAVVRRVFDVASPDVVERLHTLGVLVDEMQHAPTVDVPECVAQRMVHGLTALGILEGPVDPRPAAGDLDVWVRS